MKCYMLEGSWYFTKYLSDLWKLFWQIKLKIIKLMTYLLNVFVVTGRFFLDWPCWPCWPCWPVMHFVLILPSSSLKVFWFYQFISIYRFIALRRLCCIRRMCLSAQDAPSLSVFLVLSCQMHLQAEQNWYFLNLILNQTTNLKITMLDIDQGYKCWG